MNPPADRGGEVWIAEDSDDDDVGPLFSGRFSVHWERGGRIEASFHDLGGDEAVAWARERCRVIIVRVGENAHYSAGEVNPDCLPSWPPPAEDLVRPRRPRGFEALDNTEESPAVLWDVRVQIHGEGDAVHFRAAVLDDRVAIDAVAPAPGYPAASAMFLVRASTVHQARGLAEEVCDRAVGRQPGPFGWARGIEVYPHRPGSGRDGMGVTF